MSQNNGTPSNNHASTAPPRRGNGGAYVQQNGNVYSLSTTVGQTSNAGRLSQHNGRIIPILPSGQPVNAGQSTAGVWSGNEYSIPPATPSGSSQQRHPASGRGGRAARADRGTGSNAVSNGPPLNAPRGPRSDAVQWRPSNPSSEHRHPRGNVPPPGNDRRGGRGRGHISSRSGHRGGAARPAPAQIARTVEEPPREPSPTPSSTDAAPADAPFLNESPLRAQVDVRDTHLWVPAVVVERLAEAAILKFDLTFRNQSRTFRIRCALPSRRLDAQSSSNVYDSFSKDDTLTLCMVRLGTQPEAEWEARGHTNWLDSQGSFWLQ